MVVYRIDYNVKHLCSSGRYTSDMDCESHIVPCEIDKCEEMGNPYSSLGSSGSSMCEIHKDFKHLEVVTLYSESDNTDDHYRCTRCKSLTRVPMCEVSGSLLLCDNCNPSTACHSFKYDHVYNYWQLTNITGIGGRRLCKCGISPESYKLYHKAYYPV